MTMTPYQRDSYEDWIRDYLQRRYPDLVGPLRATLDAFETATASGILTHEQLRMIVEGVRSPRRPLAENVAALLGKLASRFPQAREQIVDLSRDAKVHVRVNALAALSAMDAGDTPDVVLRAALEDRSTRLRLLAASKIVKLGVKSLLPDLAQAILREKNPQSRDRLEWERDLLKQGYCARRESDGQVWVTCRLPDGSLRSRFFSSADVESRGLKAIARSLAAEI